MTRNNLLPKFKPNVTIESSFMSKVKAKIEEISPDPQVQELLRFLDDGNGVIKTKEVDGDGDGFLDINPVTQVWPEYLFRRVENALFSKRLISSKHEHPPVYEMTLANPSQTKVSIRTLDAFDPEVVPGTQVDLRSMGLGNLDLSATRLNLTGSLIADNPSTPVNEGLANIAKYLVEDYFLKHPKALSQFKITDIYHLTPRQAVLLASYIPIERIQYSQVQAYGGATLEREVNDYTPIEQLFQWDQDANGNGVCRNYATVARGILDALKTIQDPATSQINTTYALEIGYEEGGRSTQGFVGNHAWNGYITLTSEGIEATVLDSTWADVSSKGVDPAQDGYAEIKLDYTRERFATLMGYFGEKGLMGNVYYGERVNLPPSFEDMGGELFSKWHRYHGNWPTVQFVMRTEPTNEQYLSALDGMQEYFSQVDLNLVRYRRIILANEDDVSDYFAPRINIQHFIDDFNAMKISFRKNATDVQLEAGPKEDGQSRRTYYFFSDTHSSTNNPKNLLSDLAPFVEEWRKMEKRILVLEANYNVEVFMSGDEPQALARAEKFLKESKTNYEGYRINLESYGGQEGKGVANGVVVNEAEKTIYIS